jgi:hypothetical protein
MGGGGETYNPHAHDAGRWYNEQRATQINHCPTVPADRLVVVESHIICVDRQQHVVWKQGRAGGVGWGEVGWGGGRGSLTSAPAYTARASATRCFCGTSTGQHSTAHSTAQNSTAQHSTTTEAVNPHVAHTQEVHHNSNCPAMFLAPQPTDRDGSTHTCRRKGSGGQISRRSRKIKVFGRLLKDRHKQSLPPSNPCLRAGTKGCVPSFQPPHPPGRQTG